MEKISLGISREEGTVGNCRNFSDFVRHAPHRLNKKMLRKITAFEFIQTGNYFYFNSFISFETVLFTWLNPLVPGVPNLYLQYHLILSFTMQKQQVVRRCSSK